MSDLSNYAETSGINALLRNVALQVAAVYAALHTGDPGETGAANEITALGGYTRESIAFSAPTDGVAPSSGDVTFGPATEDWGSITHVSLWDTVAAGNCLFKGALTTPRTVNNGDSFKFTAGNLTAGLA